MLILSLLLTGLAYSAVPLIYCHSNKDTLTAKKYKKFVIIYVIAVKVLLILIYAALDMEQGSYAPAVIWGVVAYYWGRSMIEKASKCGSEENAAQSVAMEPEQKNNPIAVAEPDSQEAGIEPEKPEGVEESLATETQQAEENPAPEENAEFPQKKILYCYKCGCKLREGSLYCSRCGAKVE